MDWMERIASALACEVGDLLIEPETSPTSDAPDLAHVLGAVSRHWKSLGTDYARRVFAEDLYRHFPAIRKLSTKMVDND